MRTITLEITLWDDDDAKVRAVQNAISRDPRVVTVSEDLGSPDYVVPTR